MSKVKTTHQKYHAFDMKKKLMWTTFNDHITYKCRHHNIKFTKFLYVNGQRNLLSTPFQPMESFNIVPYGTVSEIQKILPYT